MRALILLLILISCAQNSRKYADIDEVPESSNIDELDNSFKKRPEEIKYIASLDFVADFENSLDREVLASDSHPNGFINDILYLCKNDEIEKGLQKADTQYYQFKGHPDYWNAVGICYYGQNQYRKALLYFQKSIDIDPNYAPAINSFGMVYFAQNKINKAYEAFFAASKKSPGSLVPRLNLAQILMVFGHYNKAEILLANLPEILQVQSLRLIINFYSKDKNNSIKAIEKLWSSNSSDPVMGLNYSIILANRGDRSLARKVLKSLNIKDLKKNQYQTVEKIIEGEL
jgi:tetratricopeptide (TPR) repeat protein